MNGGANGSAKFVEVLLRPWYTRSHPHTADTCAGITKTNYGFHPNQKSEENRLDAQARPP
jgi:hypothetical protein